jgi:hypothetical protein
MVLLNTLNGRRAGQSHVREAAFEQHFKLDDADAHHSITIQETALHLEMAEPILVNELTNSFQRSLMSSLWDLFDRSGVIDLNSLATHLRASASAPRS